jgi:hypothetical protein
LRLFDRRLHVLPRISPNAVELIIERLDLGL